MKYQSALKALLEWQSDLELPAVLADTPQNRLAAVPAASPVTSPQPGAAHASASPAASVRTAPAAETAAELARGAGTLEDLRAAIAGFEGLDIKKTAANMVFSDGNPQAPLMIVGEAPGSEEDRQGKPFVGKSGQLLDRILSWIGLSRDAEDSERAVYIANILNWRPPGNRNPTPEEMAMSLPFIERHIALVRPRCLLLCGGIATRALWNESAGVTRIRGHWREYHPLTPGIETGENPIPALATFHPSYLLRSPEQKRLVWRDFLELSTQLERTTKS